MELFSVKRYTENEKDKGVEDEEAILQKLLKKVEKRKSKQKKLNSDSDKKKSDDIALKKAKLDDIDPVAADEEPPIATNALENEEDLSPADGGFQIIGEDVNDAKRQKVEMVLPPWLAHPTIIASSIPNEQTVTAENAVENLVYLAPHIRHSLKEMGIKQLFPVQTEVIPWILNANNKPPPFRPRDICVSAPTGSGKTLAFAIPVVQLLADRAECRIRALIVLPVAELALQVFRVFKSLCAKTSLNVCLLSKQTPFAVEQGRLIDEYKGAYLSKVDIVVTTPGRLVDHLHETKGFCLKSLKFLVIDEADRIMDAVFQNWLYHFDEHVRDASDQLLTGRSAPLCYNELLLSYDKKPHKLLFSATLSQDPEKLQSMHLFHPKLFTSVLTNTADLAAKLAELQSTNGEAKASGEFIGKYTTPAELSEKYCITESRLKPLTLFSLMNENGWNKFLCFTNSADSSNRLSFVLQELIKSSKGSQMIIKDLSASLSAAERNQTLSRFSRGLIHGLICSDALARGIDVPDVDIVISYDLPRHIKTYIHRIGRTARAGRPGTAITLLTQSELDIFNKTLTNAGKVITDEITVTTNIEETYAKEYINALNQLKYKVETAKKQKLIQKSRAAKQSLAHKNPESMTLMEKLQVKASEQIEKTVVEKKIIEKPTEKISKLKKPRKINMKSQVIEE